MHIFVKIWQAFRPSVKEMFVSALLILVNHRKSLAATNENFKKIHIMFYQIMNSPLQFFK